MTTKRKHRNINMVLENANEDLNVGASQQRRNLCLLLLLHSMINNGQKKDLSSNVQSYNVWNVIWMWKLATYTSCQLKINLQQRLYTWVLVQIIGCSCSCLFKVFGRKYISLSYFAPVNVKQVSSCQFTAGLFLLYLALFIVFMQNYSWLS